MPDTELTHQKSHQAIYRGLTRNHTERYYGHIMNMQTKQELTKEILSRPLKATKKQKKNILDEFCANTRYERKYAITKLRKLQLARHGDARPVGKHSRNRERMYDLYVSAVVEQIYEVLGGIGA